MQTLFPKLWPQKNWLLHNDNAPSNTPFLHQKVFYQKQHDCGPSLTLLFSVSLIEDKTERKGSHFDTTEVIKAAILTQLG
jgi:hypothetical protein